MTLALSTWQTVAVVASGYIAAIGCLGFLGCVGRRLERRPRTVDRGRPPAHYEQVRRELEAERCQVWPNGSVTHKYACQFDHTCDIPLDQRDVDLWTAQLYDADTEDITREAAP